MPDKYKNPWLLYFISLLLLFPSCVQKKAKRSQLFDEVFKSEQATFRGVNLGDNIKKVIEMEAPLDPKYVDQLGVAYELTVAEGQQLSVEYYVDNKKTGQNSNKVTSIWANILLDDEVMAVRLYNEIQEYFNSIEAYGLSNGTYGNYTWESRTNDRSRMEVILKLNNNRQGITLNFLIME